MLLHHSSQSTFFTAALSPHWNLKTMPYVSPWSGEAIHLMASTQDDRGWQQNFIRRGPSMGMLFEHALMNHFTVASSMSSNLATRNFLCCGARMPFRYSILIVSAFFFQPEIMLWGILYFFASSEHGAPFSRIPGFRITLLHISVPSFLPTKFSCETPFQASKFTSRLKVYASI